MHISSIRPDGPESLERARARFDRFSDLSARYREDEALRARLDGGDAADLLSALEIDLPDGVEARVVADTAETVHFILPPDPNAGSADGDLHASAGGESSGPHGSVDTGND